jgi:hypothetical protein
MPSDASPGPAAGQIPPRWRRPRSVALARRVPAGVSARRRELQIALGLVWLLDAVLQFQPFMFSRSFVTQVVQPPAIGSPSLIAHTVNWASEVMLRDIAIFNAAFAAVQLLVAVGLLFRRTVKAALALSIVWALAVWWFGESLGGVLTGSTPLAGLPGAVVLYALIAVLLWPPSTEQRDEPISPATAGPLGATAPRVLWAVLWVSFAYFLLLPANRAPSGIGQIFAFTDGQPTWLTSIMNHLSRVAGDHGTQVSIVLAVLCALVALGVLAAPTLRPALALAVVLALLFWVAEGLGGIFTGEGTDPNSGPLLVLLAACYWPVARPGPSRSDDDMPLMARRETGSTVSTRRSPFVVFGRVSPGLSEIGNPVGEVDRRDG